jgi:uncharacterized protein YbcI
MSTTDERTESMSTTNTKQNSEQGQIVRRLHQLALSDATVSACLTMHRQGKLSYTEALELALVSQTEQLGTTRNELHKAYRQQDPRAMVEVSGQTFVRTDCDPSAELARLRESNAELLAATRALYTRTWNSNPDCEAEKQWRREAIDRARAAIYRATGRDESPGYDKGPMMRAAIAKGRE